MNRGYFLVKWVSVLVELDLDNFGIFCYKTELWVLKENFKK